MKEITINALNLIEYCDEHFKCGKCRDCEFDYDGECVIGEPYLWEIGNYYTKNYKGEWNFDYYGNLAPDGEW